MIQRQRRDEAGKPIRMRAYQVGHRVVRKAREVERDAEVGIDRLDRRRGQREDLTVVGTEFLQPAESDFEIVQKRDVQPSLRGAGVDDDALQPVEERLGKNVIEYVDAQAHRWSPWPVASAASCAGSAAGPLPRQAT